MTVFRKKLSFFGGHTVHALKNMLGCPELQDVKELIEKSRDLIKILEKLLVRDHDLDFGKNFQIVQAKVYKHLSHAEGD